MGYEVLFEPMNIGSVRIKNRFVMPAMDSCTTTKDHTFTDHSIAYYAKRAEGGFGLLITEYMAVCPQGLGNEAEVAVWDDKFIPNIKQLADEVHANNGIIFGQLHHIGIMGRAADCGGICVGPSALVAKNTGEPVRALTNAEVYELVELFGDAAVRVKKAGIDGCEIHGAHGYLLAQFLSRATNKRTDEFGGNFENRFRFIKLIIQNIKRKAGIDYPVILRFNVNEFMEHGNVLDDALVYARLAEQAGADCLHVSNGTGQGGYIAAPYYFHEAYNAQNVETIRREVSVPVISVGRISDPSVAEQLVATGRADFVALGRASICDPEFPNKVYEGRTDEIFQCTGCLQRCWYSGGCEEEDTGISCMLNPFSGKEDRWIVKPAEKKRRLAVVGAGPGGLECAWVLARRGHQVHVYEREATPGGAYALAAVPPHKQDFANIIYTYGVLGRKYGVQYHYNYDMTPEKLNEIDADGVILATGSQPFVPSIPGLTKESVILANDILAGKRTLINKKVLVLGGGLVGCETAEVLHWYDCEVAIVEMTDQLAREAVSRSRAVLVARLKDMGIKHHLKTKVVEVLVDGIVAEDERGELRLNGFDYIVASLGTRSYNPLEPAAIMTFGVEHVWTIGDARRAKDAKMAIYEGAKLGNTI